MPLKSVSFCNVSFPSSENVHHVVWFPIEIIIILRADGTPVFVICPMIPFPVEVSILKEFDQMSIAINPFFISFTMIIMVVRFCPEPIHPLIKKTKDNSKDYSNNDAEQHLA